MPSSFSTSAPKPESPDVLIVGSGAAGLSAALRCQFHGLRPLIIEKSSKIGGTTAWSGGGLWIPLNEQFRQRGVQDSEELALRYLDNLIAEGAPVSSPERRLAYVRNAARVIDSFTEMGCKWVPTVGMPDYHTGLPGSLEEGRTIESDMFDGKQLGPWRQHLKSPSTLSSVPLHIHEGKKLSIRNWEGIKTLFKVVFRYINYRVSGREPMALGQALVGQLLKLNLDRGTQIWRSTALQMLITDDKGRVIGGLASRDGEQMRIHAKAVVLAAGGFSKSEAMRKQYHAQPTNTAWSSVPPEDTGEVIQAGIAVGGATAIMDAAWWNPTFMSPQNGKPYMSLGERGVPGSIIVDSSGKRFLNEAESYNDFGNHQYERSRTVSAIPAWMIADSAFRRRQPLTTFGPMMTRGKGIAAGYLYQAPSIEELAKQINIDAEGLVKTVERFNSFANAGRDFDFGRGDTASDRMSAVMSVKPNPNLAPISKLPFFAVRVYPGDIGTKGGLLTDEHARVLDEEGGCIPGLYAAGNTAASVMGRRYAGAGATLGPVVVFASLAVDHVAAATCR